MSLAKIKLGSEHGIEKRNIQDGLWYPINKESEGFESYEKAYQTALVIQKMYTGEYRVVVYDYNRLGRKNIRILTNLTKEDDDVEVV